MRGRWPWQLLAAPGDIPELLREGGGGTWVETPGQAVATELGGPGPLHLETVGTGVGPARSPQPGPEGARGVPLPQGGRPEGRVVVARAELALGSGAGEHPGLLFLLSSSLVILLHLFSSACPSCLLLLFLLFLSSSSSHFLSPFFFWAASSSFSCLLLAFTSFSS